MRILFAANDGVRPYHIASSLDRHGFRLTRARIGDEVLEFLETYSFDAIVLAGGFKGAASLGLLRMIRRLRPAVPVLIIADEALSPAMMVTALSTGADDVVSTIKLEELVARLTAIIRRTHGHRSSMIHSGRLCIDVNDRCARVDYTTLPLTPSEYDLLEALALRKGRVMTKEAIFDVLYSGEDDRGPKIIDVFVCKLRKKLIAALDGEDPIETIWGRGYLLRDTAGADLNAAA